MAAIVQTVAYLGLEARGVEVQVQLIPGVPAFYVVGLGDKAVAESRERVRAAISALGLALPPKRIVVNLSPADLPKEGSHFDLPIALALLGAMAVIDVEQLADYVVVGELGLDGRIAPSPGVLLAAMHANAEGKGLVCPATQGSEAAWAGSIEVLAAPDLLALINHFKGHGLLAAPPPGDVEPVGHGPALRQVRGQEVAKRALEIAAAGSHNLLMVGPPGAGKSLMASCLPGILPPLDAAEALEVSMVQSVAGTLAGGRLTRNRPFRSPHHSASMAALTGGGLKVKPGEVSLAHLGVLFLDELPEFQRAVLDSLRQPLEAGVVSVARANAHVTFPARVQLIAAMNPCRCGHLGDASLACARAPRCAADYQAKVSGPLIDRIAQLSSPKIGCLLRTRLARLAKLIWFGMDKRSPRETARMPLPFLRTNEVFGISTEILKPSYVNRGDLDATITRLLDRNFHIALRGESKCGKSWLRQANIPDAIVVQCRLNKTPRDLYTDVLSQLGLNLVIEQGEGGTKRASLEATQEFGVKLLAKLAFKQTVAMETSSTTKTRPVGRDLDDLRFVADIINESGRRLVIEDFHYLSPDQRRAFAFDLKAFWDYKTYVVVIGIWAENNLLIHLNSDLAGRIEEVSIFWSADDLKAVLDRGADALQINFPAKVCARMINDSFGTVGILQRLALSYLDEVGVHGTADRRQEVGDEQRYEDVAMKYAEQLNALYQTFAQRVANGIRQRANSTGIYAHMLAVVMEASDAQLTDGFSTDAIFKQAAQKEARIKRANLGSIMRKINAIQVDPEGRGLILSYDDSKDEVFVVDKHLFFYRKYATAQWPWERVIREAEEQGDDYTGRGD